MPRILATLTCILTLTACAEHPQDEITWLDRAAIPLAGADPTLDLTDLAPLAEMIGDAHIVGLGESTHGTREHFQLKHRLVQYLVEEQGFDIFAIEASTPEAHRLDAYVLGGDGDPRDLIAGMYFWTWNTQEVLDMVEWMRAHNARSEHKIHFTGFDMQTPDVAAAEVVAFLEDFDPERARDVEERYAGMVKAKRASSFATATYSFPVDAAVGKTVRFEGWIRTADVEGSVGLWWRIDGEQSGSLGFDNMGDRGIAGTTDWTAHAIEMPVPAGARNINFGFLLSGTGTAWFDGATVELDGVPHPLPDLDLDFEGELIGANYATNYAGYTSTLDATVAHGGGQSLRLASVVRAEGELTADEAVEDAARILDDLRARREEWLAARSAAEVERFLFNARLVHQCMSARAAEFGNPRDEAMAENVAWLAEQHPDARIVLWAHNYHVSRRDGAMGDHLNRRFGRTYLPVGFATATGQYYAWSRTQERIHDLQAPPADSFEARFQKAAAPVFALDIRQAEPGGNRSRWLLEVHPFRSIGALAMDEQFAPVRLTDLYDVVVFVEETTAARQLGSVPARAN